jgi:HEAT repeat protein
MTLTMRPAIKLPSHKGARFKDATEVSEQKLRDIVRGKDRTFARSQAMAALQASDVGDKHVEFERVLANELEPSELRYKAAQYLARINTPDALKSLVKNGAVSDRETLTGVVKALGQIGDRSALPALAKVQRSATGHVQKLARFSAALIAHRSGLEEADLPVPAAKDLLGLPAEKAAPIARTVADQEQIKLCLKTIGRQPFGIKIDETFAYQLVCANRRMMILFNRDLRKKNALNVAKRKTFLGLVAVFYEGSKSYSVRYLLLTSPAAKGKAVDILVALTNGEIVFSGEAKLVKEVYDFKINAVARPGAHSVNIKGNWTTEGISFREATSSLVTQVARKTPVEVV